MLVELHSSKLRQSILFALGLAVTVATYFLLQVVAAFAVFFIYGSGQGAAQSSAGVGVCFVVAHIGFLSLLFKKEILYTTWLQWAVNAGLAIGLFLFFELYHPH